MYAAHLANPADRVEHGDLVADELEGVAVAGDDRDVHALRLGLDRERGDDVVGLEPLGRDHRHLQGVEHLLDEADLAGELVGDTDRFAL